MNSKGIPWGYLVCLFLVLSPAGAQQVLAKALFSGHKHLDDPPVWPDTIRLNPTTIMASYQNKSSNSPGIYSLSPSEMKAIGGESLGSLLIYSGLLHIKNYGPGNLLTATSRGLPASHTIVEWNGLPITSLSTGQSDLSMVPLVGQPEILLYAGTQASHGRKFSPGGTIALGTNNILARNESPELSLQKGSFAAYRLQTSFPWRKKNYGLRWGALYANAKNDFAYTNPLDGKKLKRLDAGYHALSCWVDGALKTDNHLLALHIWTQKHFREIPRPILSVQLPGNEWIQQDAFRLSFSDRWLKGNFEGMTTLGYLYDFFSYRNLSGKITSTMATHQPMLNNNITLKINKLNFQSNIRLARQQAFSANYPYNPGRTVLQVGLNASFLLAQWLSLQTHYDFEKASQTAAQWHPLLSFEVHPTPQKNLTVRLSMGKTSRFPSFNDLYWTPGGNPLLKPEKIQTAEAGLSYKYRTLDTWNGIISIIAYKNHVEDWILWQPDNTGSIWSATNLGYVNSRGIEAQGSLGNETLFLKATISLNSVWEVGKENYQLPYSPHIQASGIGIYQVGAFSFHTTAVYTSRRYLDKENLSSLPGYWNIDAGLSYGGIIIDHEIEIRMHIKNLLNKKYEVVAWQPMPGINYLLSVTYRLNKQSITQ